MNEYNVSLRAVEPEDVDFILSCEEDPEASKWSDYRAPMSRNQLMTYSLTYDADPFSAGQLRLIILKDTGERVGILDLFNISEKDLKAFVGICIHPSFRSKGLAKMALLEAASLCMKRLGLRQLVATVSNQNQRGLDLFKNAGFRSITVLPSWHRIGQNFHDFHLFLLDLVN